VAWVCPLPGKAQIGGRATELMDGLPRYIVMAALAAVSLVLLAGLWNMLRGSNPNLSQTLMRWRVGLQFLAVVIMMVLVYLLRP
jgi:Hypoxia induced protein conserved region